MRKHSIILIAIISVIVIGIVAMLFLLGGDKEQEVGQLLTNTDETVVDTDDGNETVEDGTSQNEEQETEIWEIYKHESGEFYIGGYNGTDKVVYIPEEVDGHKITGLTGNSFSNNKIIEEVYLPETIKTVSSHSFYKCDNLKKVSFPETLQYIGEYAFSFCKSLKEVTLPKELEFIGGNAFSMCSSLTTVNFNCTKLTNLNTKCFAYTALKTVTIPECVTFIDDAFISDEKLESAYVPASVVEMDISFFRCPNVTIYTPKGSYAESYAKTEGYKFIAQ